MRGRERDSGNQRERGREGGRERGRGREGGRERAEQVRMSKRMKKRGGGGEEMHILRERWR